METFWLAIAASYGGNGRRIIVCYPKVQSINPRLTDAGIECVEFDFNFAEPRNAAAFCRDFGIGTVYFSDRAYTSRVYMNIRRTGVRHIIVHDHTPGERSRPAPLKRILKTAIARVAAFNADAYIACSRTVMQRFGEIACLPTEKCHLAMNGVDMSKFAPSSRNVRHELGVQDNELLVVSSGRATRYKGIHHIIDAARQLSIERPDLSLQFIHCGDGPDLDFFQSRILESGLGQRFRLLGMRKDVPAVLMSADIAVHASEGEGLSLAILEFMAAGLATVVPDSPTVAQSIDNGRTGLLYKPGAPDSLAQTLIALADDRSRREQLGKAARTEVTANYNLSTTVNSVLRVFAKLGA